MIPYPICRNCGAMNHPSYTSCQNCGYSLLHDAPEISKTPINEDLVKPSRYNTGKIEVWDFILDQGLGFLDGNIVKYLCRKGKKDGASVLQDLKKARVYLDKLIEEEEKK